MSGCRRALKADGGRIALTNRTPDKGDGVSWRWSRGAAVPRSAFGDPLTSASYAFCVYDATSVVLDVPIPAGGICNARTKKPCWRAVRKGFAYRNGDRAAAAIQSLDLREGATDNVARVAIRGRGPLLAMPDLAAVTLPLTVQLQATNGECWEALYSPPATKQSVKSLVDRAD